MPAEWTSGYVANIGYTFGYYAELNPLRARVLLLDAGLALPMQGVACELGFGQGVSVNVHAAASGTQWYGTDFNPTQAAYAQQLASTYSEGARLCEQSFAEYCARTDLPDFDYIALHGIWSWVSDDNRHIIVDFIRRKLKAGGVLYVSYNTLPGWTPMVPLRNLLTQHAATMTPQAAGVAAQVGNAISFARQLWATNPAYAQLHPELGDRLNTLAAQDPHYLAHEYFNRDWAPMSFADMADWMHDAKLEFACSATAGDHVPHMHMTPAQIALLEQLPDPLFRQSVRDFIVNRQFRRDYWIKGPRQLAPLSCAEQLRRQRLVLCMPAADVPLCADTLLGRIQLEQSVYRPLLELMADHRPRTLGEIADALQARGITPQQLQQAVLVLMEKAALALAQDDDTIARCRPRTEALNRELIEQARGSADIHCLASPVLGGGVAAPRMHRLFLLARAQGLATPFEWAQYCHALLKSQQHIVTDRDGVALTDDARALEELNQQARAFHDKRLPVLVALGVA